MARGHKNCRSIADRHWPAHEAAHKPVFHGNALRDAGVWEPCRCLTGEDIQCDWRGLEEILTACVIRCRPQARGLGNLLLFLPVAEVRVDLLVGWIIWLTFWAIFVIEMQFSKMVD